jgi:IS5 family transposase
MNGGVRAMVFIEALKELLPLMEKVYEMTERREIQGEKVPVTDKLFSICELSTDIIVKGGREAKFGHKVNLGTGKSNMILTCETEKGNPKDSELFQGALDKVTSDYGITPKSVVTDGGYGSLENQKHAIGKKITNIVFNKIVGALKCANIEYAKGEGIINIVFNKIVGSVGNVRGSKRKENLLDLFNNTLNQPVIIYNTTNQGHS